jgi:muramoyltetrapeptide carboxypeptidase
MNRKGFITKLALGSGLVFAPFVKTESKTANRMLVSRPPIIRPGDTAAIVSPAGSVVSDADIRAAVESLRVLGLKTKLGSNVGSRWGYLGGRDSERVNDIHQAFEDPEVKVIFPIRGGYGSSRILPMVDFDLIRRNPKAFVGFSDNTSLIVSMNMFANMVTFYGPNAHFDWTNFTRENLTRVLMNTSPAGLLAQPRGSNGRALNGVTTIVPGRATGQLMGGNLSLLVQTLGTQWEVDTRGKILFFEDVNESPYRIDRMLTHLWLARKLQVAAGFAIGHITVHRDRSDDLDLLSVIRDRFEPLGKPCYMGVPTGHVSNIVTLPLGIDVEMDANRGTLRTLEGAVA